MGTFGDTLRQARDDLGVSLADAERETHVHRRYLEALESEDPTALPPPVYTRGVIRTYSQYLGLNPEIMLDLFGRKTHEAERPELRPIPAQLTAPRSIPFRPVVVLGFVVMAGLLATYLWSQYTSFVESVGQAETVPTSVAAATPTVPAKPTQAAAAATPIPAATPSVVPPASAAPPASGPSVARSRGLVVEARIAERTWVRVWVDERKVLEETVQAGSRTFTAEQQVRMQVANAAVVQVLVNGVSQGSLGAQGQAVDASWNRQ